jgi:hypothetical protein
VVDWWDHWADHLDSDCVLACQGREPKRAQLARLLHLQPLLLPASAHHGLCGAGPPGTGILTPTADHSRRVGLRSQIPTLLDVDGARKPVASWVRGVKAGHAAGLAPHRRSLCAHPHPPGLTERSNAIAAARSKSGFGRRLSLDRAVSGSSPSAYVPYLCRSRAPHQLAIWVPWELV